MTLESEKILDETGWRLLQELQQNARLSYTELGQRVGLSLPSVAERVRKMEEVGILTGYHAEVNLPKLGLPILAIIRLGSFVGQSCNRVASQVSEIPEVLECYKVTGTDCVVIKVAAASIDHLERIIEQVSRCGPAATSLVFSRPMKRHTITHELLERAGSFVVAFLITPSHPADTVTSPSSHSSKAVNVMGMRLSWEVVGHIRMTARSGV